MIFAAGLGAGMLVFFLIQSFFFAPEVTAVFSPEDGHKIIYLIDSAHKTLDIEIYVFSSRDVVEAIERARDRGVDIRIIIEKDVISGENDAIFRELSAKGFRIRYASEYYKLTHSKFMIIDGSAVLVGSHNLSNSALYKNREASVIIRDPVTAQKFIDAFETDWRLAG